MTINCFRCKVPLVMKEYETGVFGLFCTEKFCGVAIRVPFQGVISLDHPIIDTWSPEEKALHYEEIIKELHPMVTNNKRSDKEETKILPEGHELVNQVE